MISVERFNEIFNRHNYHTVSVPDLIIVSTAKYLMDFYNLPYSNVHILTMDKALKGGINKIKEIPNAFDPSIERISNVFKSE